MAYKNIEDQKANALKYRINNKEKLDAYQTLASQVRSFRSPELLKNIAFCRGNQSNTEYAEGFQVLRWID